MLSRTASFVAFLSNVGPQSPGAPAAHETIRLPLLPSGPDGVREAPLRGTQALRSDVEKNDVEKNIEAHCQAMRRNLMAESERFELSVQCSPYTRFPGVLLQPLGQLSKA